MDEPTLLRSSAAVLVGTVTAIESGVSATDGAIHTYVHVQPERVIKGPVGLAPLVLREPGGTVGEDRQVIFGSPEFWVGERTLLFLSRNRDGTLQTNSLAMGKFAIGVDAAGHATAVRDFGVGASLLMPETGAIVDAPRQTQRFLPMLKRLHELAGNERRTRPQADPVVPVPDELASTSTRFQEAFTFSGSPAARWFQPDTGQPVNYYIDYNGDRTLGFATTQAAIDAAFSAWSSVPTSSLVLRDAGTTSPGLFSPCDVNRITFNDPYREIADPSGCSGILAVGGYCSGGGRTVVNGITFNQIVVGKLTFNNGWGGCSFWNQCNVAEVATHEIGHTIGFGHSSDWTATMAAYAHFDGRCARLYPDDVNGLNAAYPRNGIPAATPTPTQTPLKTAAPTWTPTRAPSSTPTPFIAATPTVVPTRTATPIAPATATPTVAPTRTATRPPLAAAPPAMGVANDACVNATVIAASPYAATANAATATAALTDPYPSCNSWATRNTIWYKYTAPRSGTIVADTFGSNYNTVLSTYTGSCTLLSAVPRVCSDNASFFTAQSKVSFAVVAGRAYYFMVSTPYYSASGTATFHLTLY